ncbi:MAG TPA: FecR domain-containing protein [Chitinophaga sp.]|uniref:FecR family protein n=1 Tax=Chitinophaga sp. TaxID=1869181 RepID=UPI002DB8EC8D|nr:FecR domain-containing protein [Chitinophaga sp.]HEU4552336.1 FecR domain-containing protein [Chitinophaga sp.]
MDRYVAGEADNNDWLELAEMVRSGRYDGLLQQFITEVYDVEEGMDDVSTVKWQELLYKIYAAEEAEIKAVRPVRSIIARYWGWAAAVLVLVLSGIAYFNRPPQKPPVARVAEAPKNDPADIKPVAGMPVLTLADGSTVTLDTAGHQVLRQGNTAIRQQKGQLLYENSSTGKEVSFNTLTTPRGVQYRLVLPDGTAVWLNTGTSLRYPVAFTGKERKVILTGEAYFEVKHDSKRPFRIQAGNQLIEDLGTNFNIKAYADEPVMKTTLLEGAVKVGNTILKPGEQAQVNEKGDIAVARNINVADVMAWKNGFFVFRDDNLKTVMREIARWYDVEVIYQPNVNNNQQFSGKIDRSLTLTQVLNGLALTKARFTITDNREVVILP